MSGGGSSRTEEGKKKARIEIIPLIDVIFFLLATFVLFTLSLNKISSLPISLPVAGPPGKPGPSDVTLQVSDQETMFWNREPIEFVQLAPRLKNYKETVAAADQRILVAGDRYASFGATVAVIDEIRKAEITSFSVETRTSDTGK
jgi:biopolymer transport protein ExbD